MTTSWAVVTGASGGLGEGYAHELARQGADVALVARSEDKLTEVAAELRHSYGVATDVLACDLTDRDARTELVAELAGREVHTLVNNAGFASLGAFQDVDPGRLSRELELNVAALTELTRALVPQMAERDRGAIINVASTAAFQPIPDMAVYAATKAYVLSLSGALWGEYRGTGVRVVCICPGPTETSFFDNAGNADVMKRRRTVDQVVDSTFKALRARRPYVVDGVLNNVMAQATRFSPTALTVHLSRYIATH